MMVAVTRPDKHGFINGMVVTGYKVEMILMGVMQTISLVRAQVLR